MYRVHVKGSLKTLEIEDSQYDQLRTAMNLGKKMVELNNGMLDLSSIKLIEQITGEFESKADKIQKEHHREELRKFYDKRRDLLKMAPWERAKANAWSHFGLFFWGYKGRKVIENETVNGIILSKDNIQKEAERFYESHSDWDVPSVKIWYDFIKAVPSDDLSAITPFQQFALRVVENVEGRAIEDIKGEKEWLLKQSESSKTIPIKTDEINVEDLAKLW